MRAEDRGLGAVGALLFAGLLGLVALAVALLTLRDLAVGRYRRAQPRADEAATGGPADELEA